MSHPSLHARRTPDKVAYAMAGGGAELTYAALDARSNQGAQLFRSLGLRTGANIAFMLENRLEFMEIVWAAQRSGLLFTPISSYLTAEEVGYIVSDCEAELLIVSERFAPLAEGLRGTAERLRQLLIVGGDPRSPGSWEAARARMPSTPIADEATGIGMNYSSGTTGRPKGVRPKVPARRIDEPDPFMYRLSAEILGMDSESVFLTPAPLYHAAPLRFNMMVGHLGCTSIIMEKFEPNGFLQLLESRAVTHTKAVPTMFVRLLKLAEEAARKADHGALRAVIHAGAPCPVAIKQRMIDWLGPIVYEYYTGTESNGLTFIDSRDWLAHRGSVGRAAVGTPHIMAEDGETELPVGGVGLVYFEGGPAFSYHKDPAKTAKAYNSRGWSCIGDIGHLDSEGYLFLTDRRDDVVISGGVNVYPQEVEDVLIAHPQVCDVAVFGVPHEELGQQVKAVVQPLRMDRAGPALEAELRAYCTDRLSKIKCPKSIDFDARLPRTETGKMLKRTLRDRYAAENESSA